jgi:crotonobetainyl-CoA:carnitine CoA-transferase CaiB-like acyl-CoA transferase
MPGALEGLTVLDLTSHLSGPYAAMMLADHGADVVKIERKGAGDDARRMPPFVAGESAPFMVWNRNKRSAEMDLKDKAEQESFLTLVDGADILIENFRPGVMAKLGLGYEVLSRRNPRLIYAAISGFGQTGPYAPRGGFDLMTQGMSGLMSTCGPADGPPHRLPIAISDVAAGMFLAFGILAAVEARHRTGRGQFVETSLLEAAISFGVYEAAHYSAHGTRPERIGQAHRGSSPYQCLAASDGYLTIGASQQNFWERFAGIIGRPELVEDPRFRTNADRVRNNSALIAIIEAELAKRPKAHWLAEMENAGIPCGPVLAYDEVFTDPHVLARDMWVPTEHAAAGVFKTIGVPVKLSETPGSVRRAAPTLGQHTVEVLAGKAGKAKARRKG